MVTAKRHPGLSTSQAANRLGVSAKTVSEWFANGRLTGEVTALGILVDPTSVAKVLAERNKESASV